MNNSSRQGGGSHQTGGGAFAHLNGGWWPARRASISSIHVTGIDVHGDEWGQARRVFGEKPNLNFLQADMLNEILGRKRFNLIVFAASIPYFQDLKSTLRLALERLLTEDGEIHILDSPLYTAENIDKAWEGYYFHHLLTDMESFHPKILYNPARSFRGLFTPANPFYWIRLKNR